MIIMLVFAAMDKEGNDQNSNEMLTRSLRTRLPASASICRTSPLWAAIAAGTSMSIIAGDPISLGLLAEGDRVNAGVTARLVPSALSLWLLPPPSPPAFMPRLV